MPPLRVLTIEDDPATARAIARGLAAHGHAVVAAADGAEGAHLATAEPFDLVLLDLMLPGLGGHETLARIRAARPDLPVLMLTARDSLTEKVAALDAGADGYLTKPFALDELLARMRAVTRRSDPVGGVVLRAGDLAVDLLARRVRRGRTPVELSAQEFALLAYFVRHPGRVLSREAIRAAIWGHDADPGSNVVDVCVHGLRRKLAVPGEPPPIATVRGAGYRLDRPPAPDDGAAPDP